MTMDLEYWREMKPDSDPLRDVLVALAPAPPRLLESKSGRLAVLATRAALDEASGFSAELDRDLGAGDLVGIVVAGPATGAGRELVELARACAVIAVPESAARPSDLSVAGRIERLADESETARWTLLARRSATAERMMRDAPLDPGEPPEDLDARARWFQRRHSDD